MTENSTGAYEGFPATADNPNGGSYEKCGLVPYRLGVRCWVATDRNGEDWHEEAVAHYDSEAEARAYVAEMRRDCYNDPADEAAGPHDVRQLDTDCAILYCADPECGEEYEGDEFAHVHWPADDLSMVRSSAEDAEWKVGADGRIYCPESLMPVVDHVFVGEPDDDCAECDLAQSDHRFPHDPAEVSVIS